MTDQEMAILRLAGRSAPTARELLDIAAQYGDTPPHALAARVEAVLAYIEPIAAEQEGSSRGLLASQIQQLLNGEKL